MRNGDPEEGPPPRPAPLFAPKRQDWIGSGGAARREIAGQKRDAGEKRGRGAERRNVRGAHAEEEARQKPRRHDTENEAGREAEERESSAFADEEAHDVRAVRPESEP